MTDNRYCRCGTKLGVLRQEDGELIFFSRRKGRGWETPVSKDSFITCEECGSRTPVDSLQPKAIM